jgi:hypothetical protein
MTGLADLRDEAAPTTLLLVGAVLVVVPDPATTALGAGLVLLGAAWWAYEWGR